MKYIVYTIVVLLSTRSLCTMAQSADALNHKFSLQAAIAYALTHQLAVLNAILDEEIARNTVKQTIGIGLPQISTSYSFQDFLKLPTTLLPGEFSNPPSNTPIPVRFGTKYNSTAGIELNQLIFDGSYIVGLQASRTFKELSFKNSKRTRIETAVAVTKAYYGVLVNGEQLALIDANMLRLSKSLNDTEAMFKNGFSEKIDVDRLQVLKNNLETERENVTRLLQVNIDMLKFQMGMPIQSQLTLSDKISDIRAETVPVMAIDTTVYKGRVEYSLLETQKKLNELDLKRQQSLFLPTLRGFANASKSFQSDRFSTHFDQSFPTSVIGFTLSWDLINGGQRIYQVRNAKLAVKKSENDMLNAKNAISQEISSSQKVYLNSLRSVENQQRNLTLSQEILRVARVKYEEGVGSGLEVTTAETTVKEAQNHYITALYDLLISKVDLEKAIGILKY